MSKNFKIVLNKIPEILSSNDDLDKNFEKISTELKNIVTYDNIYICYLNAGCANIQFKKNYTNKQPIAPEESIINFPEVLKTKLYDNTIINFDEKSGFFKALGFYETDSTY